MKTTIEIYCEFAGWQGGTIHQALADFVNRPIKEQDKFCTMAMIEMDKKNLQDPYHFVNFTRARIGQLEVRQPQA